MVQLPTSESSADNSKRSGLRPQREAVFCEEWAAACRRSGYLYSQLRTSGETSSAIQRAALDFQDSYCRRVLETQRIPFEQGYSACIGLGGYSAVHWSLVEPDRDTGPQWLARFVGPDVFYRLR